MTLRRLGDALTAALDTHGRNRVEFTLRPTRVEARNADGTLSVRPLDGECIATAPPSSLYVGQEYVTPPAAPFKMQGAAGVAMLRASRTFTRPELISFSPDFWLRGGEYTVAITGRGLTIAYLNDLLLPSAETIHEGITIDEIRWLDDTSAEMDVTVSSSATLVPEGTGDAAFENVGEA